MSIKLRPLFTAFAICFLSGNLAAQTTVDQTLEVVTNDLTLGGNFQIQLLVKGTNLPAANTLGSATIDITYDNSKLTYVNSTNWGFGFLQGYSRSATNNTTFVRILVTGAGVNENGGGVPPGFDIGTSNATWVQLNFTIADPTGTTSLTIASGSNAVGIFENHQNEPNTGVIIDQPLSTPNNLGDVALPVELSTFEALAVNNTVRLKWATESEVNNLGFEVMRSDAENEGYEVIAGYQNNPGLAGQGNSNTRHEYSYTDSRVIAERTYWYKLADVDFSGIRTVHQPVAVTLSEEDLEEVPARFRLYPNYPNPFNPETVLKFDIPRLSEGGLHARFAIYNSLGQVVRKLFDGTLTAGTFEITWDGKTDSGYSLPSGFYYATLDTGTFRDTIKLVLVR